MGHTSVNTTRIYIASLDNSKLDRANRKVIVGNGHAESYFEKRMFRYVVIKISILVVKRSN